MNGFLIIDKPYGLSSYDVLRRLNKKFSLKRRSIKFGHGGTLDPLATGVLVVALGRATRMLQFFLSDTKSYRATICIGAQTTTDDAEGDIIRTAPYEHIDIEAIRSTLADFRKRPPIILPFTSTVLAPTKSCEMVVTSKSIPNSSKSTISTSFRIAHAPGKCPNSSSISLAREAPISDR